jgi:lysyl-tRNA synthetase class 2
MILKGIDLRPISKIVDIYNYISIKHMVPVGGDDTANVEGDIVLRFARGDESFTPLNSEEMESPSVGEVIYSDDKEVLCRRWNWRECDKTKMTEETRDIVLVIEGLPPITQNEISAVIDDLAQMVHEHCGGDIETAVLNEANVEIEI